MSQMKQASPPPTVQVAAAPELTLAPTTAPAATAPTTLPAPTSVTSLVTPAPDTIHASRPTKGFGVATRPAPAATIVPAAAAPAAPAAVPASVPPSTTAAEPGQLQVAVRPWGEVSVDGRVIGTTPLDRITLPVGTHVLRVRHPLYELWERPVSIRSGETAKVVVDLPTQGVRKQP
jgi:serine/threonine-protein kinase